MTARTPRRAAPKHPAREAPAAHEVRDGRWGAIEIKLYLALLFLVALVFSTGLEVQFSLPKLLAIRVLVPLIAVCWLARSQSAHTRPLPGFVIASALALAAWWVLTTAVAVHPFTALHGEHGRYNGLLNQLLQLGLFLLVASAGLRLADVETLARGFVMAMIPVSVYAIVQYAGWDPLTWPGERSASTIGNPVVLAAVLGMAMPFALVFALQSRRPFDRWMWGGALCLLMIGSVTTLSRGPLLSSAFVLLLVGGFAAWEHRQRVKRWMVAAALVAAAVVLTVGYRQVLQLRQNLTGATPLEAVRTLRDRLNTYQAAFEIVRDHPVTGVGLENFSIVYPQYRSPASEQLTPDVLPTMVHDGYLQAAATTGIPGLLLYLTLIASVLVLLARTYRRHEDRRTRWLALGVAASILVYLLQDLSGWLEISLSTFFWIVLGLGLALAGADTPSGEVSTRRSRASQLIVGAGALVACGMAVESAVVMRTDYLIWSVRLLDARDNWSAVDARLAAARRLVRGDAAYLDRLGVRYGDRYGATGDRDAYQQATSLLDEAHRLNPFNAYFMIHRIALATAALQKKMPTPDTIEDLVATLGSLDPNNASVHEAVARRRLAQGRPSDASLALSQAKALRPAVGRYDELQGDIERALNNRAAAMDAYRAATARFEGRDKTAWVGASHKLILTMLELGQFAMAVQQAQRLVGQEPGDGVGQSLLGYAYIGIKDPARARQAFEMALRINPGDQNAKQGLSEVSNMVRN